MSNADAYPSVLLLIGLVFAGLVSQACGGGSGGSAEEPAPHPGAAAASITVIPSVSSIAIGLTQQYVAVARDANGNILSGVAVRWSSSHQEVATIDNNGLARSLAPGTTTVTASQGGIESQLVNLSVTSVPASKLAPLPPWLTYCDSEPCASAAPVVVYACPAGSAPCAPARSTTITAQVDDKPISGVFFHVVAPVDISLRLISGSGIANAIFLTALQAPAVILASAEDVQISYYNVSPAWGATTALKFTSTMSTSTLLDSVFYRHPSYVTGAAATELHGRAETVITTERAMSGLSSEHVTAYFMPTELAAVQGEGNFSYGNGTVTINYGNPPYIAANGGLTNTAIARFAHEHAHELFNEIRPAPAGNASCLNEGVADAVAYTAGFLPEQGFGPIRNTGTNFDSSCTALSEMHDVGNCYFWHVKKAGLLTPAFLRGIFHPQHAFSFDSCAQNTIETGNSILVYFTEAAGGINMIPVLDSMKIPHAGSYDAAKQALGF